jgi:REP element-mobilizing transposase RayT
VQPARRRQTANLRLGRNSSTGATYFVTACTTHRRPLFASPDAAACGRQVLERTVTDGDVAWLAATVMPDHVHALFELSDRLSLGQVLAKVKGLVSRNLSPGESIWQENVFEHQLREAESAEDYALYIFMNPYRAALLPITQPWPWWICSQPMRFRFLEGLDARGVPPAEWLEWDETLGGTIVVGE